MVNEAKYHSSAILDIKYSYNGKLLIAGDKNCLYNIYSVDLGYQAIKSLEGKITYKLKLTLTKLSQKQILCL